MNSWWIVVLMGGASSLAPSFEREGPSEPQERSEREDDFRELPGTVVRGEAVLSPTARTEVPSRLRPGTTADAGELLRGLAGVSGTRMGGHGIDPIVRGQGQTRLNVLLDGAYVHGGCPNRMDPPTSYSPIESYEEVTVIRGAQTVRYGGGGTGGSILFRRRTPRFQEGEFTRARLTGGLTSNAVTRDLGVDAAAGTPLFFLRGLAHYKEADDYEDGDGQEVRSAYDSRGGTLIGGWTPAEDRRLELSYEGTRETDVLFAGAGMDAPRSDNDTWRLRYEQKRSSGPLSSLEVELYTSTVTHVMDNFSLRTQTAPRRMVVDSDSDTYGGRLSGDVETAIGEWTLGVDLQRNARDATRRWDLGVPEPTVVQSYMWPGVELEVPGVFSELDVPVGKGDRLVLGARFDRVEASIDQGKASSTPPGAPWQRSPNELYQTYYGVSGGDATENNFGGFVRYERPASKEWKLFGGFSHSVRTADATERYLAANNLDPTARWIGNPGLEPEAHDQLEVGVTGGASAWSLTTSVFYDDVADYVLQDRARGQSGVLLSDGATVYRNVDARLFGGELEAELDWGGPWSSRAVVSYVNAENTTDDQVIARTPPLEGNVSLDLDAEPWSAGVVMFWSAKQTRADTNPSVGSGLDARETPGWTSLDVYGRWRLGTAGELSLGVRNVFDRTYAHHVNRANVDPFSPDAIQVNEPGRTFWIRASFSF